MLNSFSKTKIWIFKNESFRRYFCCSRNDILRSESMPVSFFSYSLFNSIFKRSRTRWPVRGWLHKRPWHLPFWLLRCQLPGEVLHQLQQLFLPLSLQYLLPGWLCRLRERNLPAWRLPRPRFGGPVRSRMLGRSRKLSRRLFKCRLPGKLLQRVQQLLVPLPVQHFLSRWMRRLRQCNLRRRRRQQWRRSQAHYSSRWSRDNEQSSVLCDWRIWRTIRATRSHPSRSLFISMLRCWQLF